MSNQIEACLVFWAVGILHQKLMENHMEKNMAHDVETGYVGVHGEFKRKLTLLPVPSFNLLLGFKV